MPKIDRDDVELVVVHLGIRRALCNNVCRTGDADVDWRARQLSLTSSFRTIASALKAFPEMEDPILSSLHCMIQSDRRAVRKELCKRAAKHGILDSLVACARANGGLASDSMSILVILCADSDTLKERAVSHGVPRRVIDPNPFETAFHFGNF